MNYESLTDSELVTLSQAKDTLASEEIINRYKDLVKFISKQYFIPNQATEDVVQEGMIGLYKAMQSYKENSASFKTFAKLCIERQIQTEIKKANTKKHLGNKNNIPIPEIECDEQRDTFPDDNPTPLENIILKEEYVAFQNKIKTILSPFEKQVLSQFIIGYSIKEIAVHFDKSSKSIENAMARIRHKINCSATNLN